MYACVHALLPQGRVPDQESPPRLAVELHVTGIRLKLQAKQFRHLRSLMTYVRTYDVYSRYQRFRPKQKDPRTLWKFAINCVLHNIQMKRQKSRCVRVRGWGGLRGCYSERLTCTLFTLALIHQGACRGTAQAPSSI